MFLKSLKYMLLTVLVGLLLIAGTVYAVRTVQSAPARTAEPSVASPVVETPSPSPVATATPSPAPTEVPTPSPSPTPCVDPAVLSAMDGMSTEDKVGQLVMFGFSGTTKPDDSFVTLMHRYRIGNVILLADNIKTGDSDGGFKRAGRLTTALQKANETGIPMLISIDVEGGKVVRFSWRPGLKSPSDLGSAGDTDAAREQFTRIGTALTAAGINLDLAPVLDVAENPSKTYLGTRIISSDANVVADIGSAAIEGLHAGGCLSAAKHFPGHGGTTLDSHKAVPAISKSYEEMAAYDLVPFTAAIETGVDAIMTAHIHYSGLDSSNIATLSHAILTDLLRGEMGFDGVVISDDFRMTALQRSADTAEAAVQFILAGGDIILCGPDASMQETIMEALLTAVQDGTITEARLNESVARILTLKQRIPTAETAEAGAAEATETADTSDATADAGTGSAD